MIRLAGVGKDYPGSDTPAVTALDLDVAEGEIVVLIGPSGCGKTTTLKMINRLVEPTRGRIEVAGEDVTARAAPELRRSIGYVIQQVGLFPHRTIGDNVATVPRLLGWDRNRIRERVAELMALVELNPDLIHRFPSELSGGQRQRVGVARALAADPPVLLMDEPFGAVDPIVRERLQDELLRLQQRLHKTIVMVTHDLDEAIRLGDRLAILGTGGALHQYATPAEILERPADGFVAGFLGDERGLRRLSLIPVSAIPLEAGPVVAPDATAEAARACMERYDVDWFGVADGSGLAGWAWASDLPATGGLDSVSLRPFATRLDRADSLRRALDTVIGSHTRVAPVFDGDRYLGMVTADAIARQVAS